jgi:hypothetical protein
MKMGRRNCRPSCKLRAKTLDICRNKVGKRAHMQRMSKILTHNQPSLGIEPPTGGRQHLSSDSASPIKRLLLRAATAEFGVIRASQRGGGKLSSAPSMPTTRMIDSTKLKLASLVSPPTALRVVKCLL